MPVHIDADAVALEQPGKRLGGELATLVGVEDIRFAVMGHGLFHSLDAEVRFHRDGDPEGKHLAEVPVDDGRKIHEATAHGDEGDVHGPDLAGAGDGEALEQVRVDRMLGVSATRIGLAVERLDARFAHQGGHVLAPDVDALLARRSRSMRLSANGCSRCSSSSPRMSLRSASLTGFSR